MKKNKDPKNINIEEKIEVEQKNNDLMEGSFVYENNFEINTPNTNNNNNNTLEISQIFIDPSKNKEEEEEESKTENIKLTMFSNLCHNTTESLRSFYYSYKKEPQKSFPDVKYDGKKKIFNFIQ